MPTKKKSIVREPPTMETKPKHFEHSLARQDRRSWEAWTDKENHIFFDALVRHSRNWAQIAADLGTKRQEQVRTYYYRVLRKISKMLSTVHFAFDNRDRIQTLMAMTSYWEAKCETKYEETTHEFAEAVKERILRQKQAVDMLRTKRLPVPEKVILQLLPRDEQSAELIAQSGYNPKLQLTLKAAKPIASVVDHVTKKWVTESGACVAPSAIRLFPIGTMRHHRGWGLEDQEISLLSIFQSMGCPNAMKFEYAWADGESSSYSEAQASAAAAAEDEAAQPTDADMDEADTGADDAMYADQGMYEDDEESLDRISVGAVDQDLANMSLNYNDEAAFGGQFGTSDDMLTYEHPSSGDDDDDMVMQQHRNMPIVDEASFSQFISGPAEFFESQSQGFLPMRSVVDDDEEDEVPLSAAPAAPTTAAAAATATATTPRVQPARIVLRARVSPPPTSNQNASPFSFPSGLEQSNDIFSFRTGGDSLMGAGFVPEQSMNLYNFGSQDGGSSNNNLFGSLGFGESERDPLTDMLNSRSSGVKPRHDRPVLDPQEQATFSSLQHKPKRARKGDDDSSRL